MSHDDTTPMRVRWARLRFSIIGPSAGRAARVGRTRRAAAGTGAKRYQHPTTKERVRFGASTHRTLVLPGQGRRPIR